MANNLTIESPNFDRIRKGDGKAVEAGVRTLWLVLNDINNRLLTDFNTASRVLSPAVQSDAPSANQDNYNGHDATVLLFTGGTAFNLTGIRNGTPGRLFFLANLGTGTITVKHEVTSDASNRIDMKAAADKAVATNQFMALCYLNSRWREISLA